MSSFLFLLIALRLLSNYFDGSAVILHVNSSGKRCHHPLFNEPSPSCSYLKAASSSLALIWIICDWELPVNYLPSFPPPRVGQFGPWGCWIKSMITTIFGLRRTRLNGIITSPYQEATLETFDFLVGAHLAARRAVTLKMVHQKFNFLLLLTVWCQSPILAQRSAFFYATPI